VVEMLEGSQSQSISLVPRPRLKSQDQPYEEDEEVFVGELAKVLETQIHASRGQAELSLAEVSRVLEYYSWRAVFERVKRVYKTVIKLSYAS
jgi:hypothetical protein